MTKDDLIRSTANRNKITLAQATSMVEGLFEDIRASLADGRELRINGFGSFTIKTRAATEERMGRNPITQEPMKIAAKPARKVVAFRPGKELREAVAR